MTVAQYFYSGTDTQYPRAATVPTLVQSNSSSTPGSTTTATVTLPSVAAGHLIVVLLKYFGAATTSSISDGTSTLTPLTNNSQVLGADTFNTRVFYLLSSNVSAGTQTYTLTLGVGKVFIDLHVFDYSSSNAFTFDVEAAGGGSGGTGTALTSGTFNTTGTNEVVFGVSGTLNTQTTSNVLIAGIPADKTVSSDSTSIGFAKVFVGPFTGGAATATIGSSDEWVMGAAAFKADSAPSNPLPDDAWLGDLLTPRFTPLSLTFPGIYDLGADAIAGMPSVLDGGDGDIDAITSKLWPVPPSQIPPFVGEQQEWPTPIANTTFDDPDILGLLRAPIVPSLSQRLPWQADQSDQDLPLQLPTDGGDWVPFFATGAWTVVTADPSGWQNEDTIPAVQPSAPPTEDWDLFRLMGLPVVVPPPVFPPVWTTLDDTIETPPPVEDWYDPLHYTVILPPVSRLAEWSHINDLVPTQPTAPATDEPGTLGILLHVKDPVYTIFDRFTFDLDQDYPALVAVIPDIVDSPTRLYVLNFTNNVLSVLDKNGEPMAQPLIITAGETGPLVLQLAGANGAPQSLLGATCTLRLVNLNETVYANNVSVSIVNAALGTVRWTRLSSEVGTAGDYRYQVKAVLSDGTSKWFPDADPNVGNPLTILPPV